MLSHPGIRAPTRRLTAVVPFNVDGNRRARTEPNRRRSLRLRSARAGLTACRIPAGAEPGSLDRIRRTTPYCWTAWAVRPREPVVILIRGTPHQRAPDRAGPRRTRRIRPETQTNPHSLSHRGGTGEEYSRKSVSEKAKYESLFKTCSKRLGNVPAESVVFLVTCEERSDGSDASAEIAATDALLRLARMRRAARDCFASLANDGEGAAASATATSRPLSASGP